MSFFRGVGSGISRGITRSATISGGLFRRAGDFTRGIERDASTAIDKVGKFASGVEQGAEHVASKLDGAYGSFMDKTSKVVSDAGQVINTVASGAEKVAPSSAPYAEAAKGSVKAANNYRNLRANGRGAISSLFGAFAGTQMKSPTDNAGTDIDKDIEPPSFKAK